MLSVVHVRGNACATQTIRTSQTGRTRADDRHPPACLAHSGQIRAPALAKGLVGHPPFHAANGHRTERGLFQRTSALAQAILRANATADFRQRIGLVHQGGRFHDAALLHQFQPVRNVVVHRASVLAVRIAAIDAAFGLGCRIRCAEITTDLAIAEYADGHRHRAWRLSRHIEELE